MTWVSEEQSNLDHPGVLPAPTAFARTLWSGWSRLRFKVKDSVKTLKTVNPANDK